MSYDPTDLILASASPRRQEILTRLKLSSRLLPVEVDERGLPGEAPETTSWRLALAKAEGAARRAGSGVVLSADTVVAFQGEALGKPHSPAAAGAMLRRLRGRKHEVISGIAILDLSRRRGYVSAVRTRVWMRDLADDEIDEYVASGDPLDKAGAYAIQNERFRPVARIEGCYWNVVGLPLRAVVAGLQEIGFPLPSPEVLREALGDREG